ncbi:UDP pyrophosphate phosphatase [Marinobacter sp. ANT_B65]|uniref:UDP pyrophosphate phosphatase n=1 Tax=Marinobacter sp. ANT_B65 TaxID=2039467 RepID=UPI000BBE07BB|nr:UDP pyrophosphate phosphatase [Marinobacter sp. ANT_B65]PCM43653.1 UDP pyrophosphate phosphatase [Marinobacter sp. ANT_B65]
MIGGINPGSTLSYQPGSNSPARERSDVARSPASAPEKTTETARRDLADSPRSPASERSVGDNPERRVEARRASEDARLERFRADEVPLPAARALSAFASVAAAGQESDGAALAGIDILV